ncbi:translation initiation factor eIF 4e-like domain-containing protein [Blyttiomyces helicus]|uniref:Translation initiation factor eIF 4e-like domain-containing protein n=1 Tax=Blyttiomyces helicus TaxID=388810 RepID=A0A4P9VYG2_9FUNG|nr:translation initiation factor eIF 4e-like domain-containing protein [Blyttiomyces helicus]|eukprot:RKO84819.1 translation initiation factor eIF 4e-like domain-containing protein [Blyttiomyces helicus]
MPSPEDSVAVVPSTENSTIDDPIEDHPDAEIKTVFEDPIDFNIKHPLQNSWVLWFDNPQRKNTNQANWSQNLKNLITIDTVEDFWGVYNNIMKATTLSNSANYHLFKLGIQPAWEDKQNANGGKWVINVPKRKSPSGADLDQLWLYTMLACIGEAFPDSEEICGAVVSIRKVDRISLWTRSALDREKQERTGVQWKKSLGWDDKIGYQAHSDALRKNSSYSNAEMYTV